MSTSKKAVVKWNIPEIQETKLSSKHENVRPETPSDVYNYSNTFEDTPEHLYSDTFVSDCDTYSDTFINDSLTVKSDKKRVRETAGFHVIAKQKRGEQSVSFEDSETSIQEATHLETAKNVTDALETVLEVDSDLSRTEDFVTQISDTHPPTSYTDTFESSERTRVDSHHDYTYDFTQETAPSYTPDQSLTEAVSSRTRSYTKGKSFYTEEDESLLDRSFIAPDYNGKSLTDDEGDEDNTYNDEYSYTFEPTSTVTTSYVPSSQLLSEAQMTADEAKVTAQAERQFTKNLLDRLKGVPKNYSQLERLPPDPEVEEEDDYLKHYCKKKIKQLKTKKHQKSVPSRKLREEKQPHPLSRRHKPTTLSDYGLPESVMERARIKNILSAMKRAANEEIHQPSKCKQCSELKTELDSEEAERRFVTSQTMRLKNKIMDSRVEEHLLKMNSVSMIAEIARELPRHSEKPEKILDRLFEPLLGKNVMR